MIAAYAPWPEFFALLVIVVLAAGALTLAALVAILDKPSRSITGDLIEKEPPRGEM